MCGIVGAAGKISTLKEKRAFNDLLTLCQFRGRDSTGVIGVSGSGDVRYAKSMGTPDQLQDRKSYDKILDSNPAILIGHCRHTTAGSVNLRNAHPFDFDNVIGVHNGTLHHSWRQGDNARDFDVDSQWLYSRINEVGIEDALNEINKDGAWALSFFDKQRKSLNFIRNKQRPLSFCWTKSKDIMFWASEPWMLCAVERLLDVAILDEDDGSWTMDLPINTLWEVNVDKGKPAANVFTMKPPREIEGGANFTSRVWGSSSRGSTGSSSSQAKGGSGVIHPFQRGGAAHTPGGSQTLSTSTSGTVGGPSGKTPTSTSGKTSQTSSSKPTGSKMELKSGKQSRRGTLSLPSLSSMSTPTTSKRKPSDDSTNSNGNSTGGQLTLVHSSPNQKGEHLSSKVPSSGQKQVSLRQVAGIWYISCLNTSMEMSEKSFETNTKGICSFCKTPIGGLEEVHTMMSRSSFICTDCGE